MSHSRKPDRKVMVIRLLFAVLLQIKGPVLLFGQGVLPERVGPWGHVIGFAMHPNEDYLVLCLSVDGRGQLFESHWVQGQWSEPSSIQSVNSFMGGLADIGGPSLNHDASVLYFHANYASGAGGYDIYYSEKKGNEWLSPSSVGSVINTPADEMHPSVAPGEAKFFFSRANAGYDIRKLRGGPTCEVLYLSYKMPSGQWEDPRPLHDAINKGCQYSLHVAHDGRTIYYAAIDDNDVRKGYDIYVAQEMIKGQWVLPVAIDFLVSATSGVNPYLVGNMLYFIQILEERRGTKSALSRVSLPEDFLPLSTQRTAGKITALSDGRPIKTTLTVFDPTTLNKLGIFSSDEQTGSFEIPLLDHQNYIVDVRTPGFSFANFQLDYRTENKLYGPDKIMLFEQVDLYISVYDGEIFRPLHAAVTAEVVKGPQQSMQAVNTEPGIYKLVLPIGKDYHIKAGLEGFYDDSFLFSLQDDIIFSEFHRDMALEPRKVHVDIFVIDAETGEAVNAHVRIENLVREEMFGFLQEDMADGMMGVRLRLLDDYQITVSETRGYSFYVNQVNVDVDLATIIIPLTPLRIETSVVLRDIHFATNSAELTGESFAELERVYSLLKNNPSIKIEISANTDNEGSTS